MLLAAVALWMLLIALAACAGSGGEDGPDTAALTTGMPPETAGVGPAPAGTLPTPTTPESTVTPPTSGGRTTPGGAGAGAASTPRPPSGAAGTTPPATPRPPSGSGGEAAMDTARGIAAVVGATPITQVIVRPAGGRPITVTGPLAREIGTASGAEVWIRGRRVDDRTIEATGYAVRRVDGQPALTGTLAADGDRLVLVTDDGRRHVIARPPAPLRELVGARVWITGDPGGTISTYGVLRRSR